MSVPVTQPQTAPGVSPETHGRFSLYGGFWMKSAHRLALLCPGWLEPVLLLGMAVVLTIVARGPRRAIARSLRWVLGPPAWGLLGDWTRVIRVFWNFGSTLIDSMRVRSGQDILSWDISGKEHFEAMKAHPGGVLLCTAHVGSYDVAAPVFAERLERHLHTVRLPERNTAAQEYMASTRDTFQSEHFTIHYNQAENLLALTLAQALQRAEIVAIQGDRVPPGVSGTRVAYTSPQGTAGTWHLPRGPFILAAASKCPIWPIFIVRTGIRRYQVRYLPKLEISPSTTQAERRTEPDRLLQAWSETLATTLRTYWPQWVCLEPDAFQETPPQSTT